jgi:hypothetical protein
MNIGIRLIKTIAAVLAASIILPCVITQRANASTADIQTFVTSLYSDCLGRQPDPTGLNDWISKLANGAIGGKECAYGFFFSNEFRSKANSLTPGDLVDTYYRVFLNRGADTSGKNYWIGQIASTGTADDIIILFNGFADSTEFAQKCASYGIIVGNVAVPTVSSSTSIPATQAGSNTNYTLEELAYNPECWRAFHTSTPEELDAFFLSRGCEERYVTLPDAYGGEYQVRVYAQFFDMTSHINSINAYRESCGIPPLSINTDPRYVEEARQRAVEEAYTFGHNHYYRFAHAETGEFVDVINRRGGAMVTGCENVTSTCNPDLAFNNFLNSPGHANNMRRYSTSRSQHMAGVASCRIWIVNADGCSISRDFTNGQYYDTTMYGGLSLAQLAEMGGNGVVAEGYIRPGYGDATIQLVDA